MTVTTQEQIEARRATQRKYRLSSKGRAWWLEYRVSSRDKAWRKARHIRRREMALEYLGEVCVSCGATDDLEFDHIDPATKGYSITSNVTRAWDKLVIELDKCQLLCQPCHVVKGNEDRKKSSISGPGVGP